MSEDEVCAKCEIRPGVVLCSCTERFCETCFSGKHLKRNPKHRRGGSNLTEKLWVWVSGAVSDVAESLEETMRKYKQDEETKWFGLHVDIVNGERLPSLIETPRFSSLVEESLELENSPKSQSPSICSFVGDTGAGKSTLIRALIYSSKRRDSFKNLNAPVSGARAGSSATMSTTGEVNLYLDPDTFGTSTPSFYADCEGMSGTEPVASKYQTDWGKLGRRHLIQNTNEMGVTIDRRTAVRTIYPRFLYIFSDVICYVTKDHKTWVESARRLLEWSSAAVQNTINQQTSPALIIILNGPTMENEAWLSNEGDVVTDAFFRAIEKEITEAKEFRSLAEKSGAKSMKELFLRAFSHVHAHYVPLQGFGSLGTSLEFSNQVASLNRRIRKDAALVKESRIKGWIAFNSHQISTVMDLTFEHLTSGKTEPFDFDHCFRQIYFPSSTEHRIVQYLRYVDAVSAEDFQWDFEKILAVSAVLSTAFLLNGTADDNTSFMMIRPSTIWNEDNQAACERACRSFIHSYISCSFRDKESGDKCVNSKNGHAHGHQSSKGLLLEDGDFVDIPGVEVDVILQVIKESLGTVLRAAVSHAPGGSATIRRFIAEQHRKNQKALWNLCENPRLTKRVLKEEDEMCYNCIIGSQSHQLPCEHNICNRCLSDFDYDGIVKEHPGWLIHRYCPICGDSDEARWPQRIKIRPELAGVSVLSLDGGGVRGIAQLKTLERLEKLTKLDIPIGLFFDFIIGTNIGGIIALAIGFQGRDVKASLDLFQSIINSGYSKNKWMGSTTLGWFRRWFHNTIYSMQVMLSALHTGFETHSPRIFRGVRNRCRVAVAVCNEDGLQLLNNYGLNKGLTYARLLSQVAMATLATPHYFEPPWNKGTRLWDGGTLLLCPTLTAIKEARAIWGSDIDFDLVLSVGSSTKNSSMDIIPETARMLPTPLYNQLVHMLMNLDGVSAWSQYQKAVDSRVRDRSVRLNVEFQDPIRCEPAINSFYAVQEMERQAKEFEFKEEVSAKPFGSFSGNISNNALENLADRLRASLYFFHLIDITKYHNAYFVRGVICCRLHPAEEGYRQLMHLTTGFHIQDTYLRTPHLTTEAHFLKKVTFRQRELEEQIRIDANFGNPSSAAISGFPLKLSTLLKLWESQNHQPQRFKLINPESQEEKTLELR